MKKNDILLTDITNAVREIDRKEAETLGLKRANGNEVYQGV